MMHIYKCPSCSYEHEGKEYRSNCAVRVGDDGEGQICNGCDACIAWNGWIEYDRIETTDEDEIPF